MNKKINVEVIGSVDPFERVGMLEFDFIGEEDDEMVGVITVNANGSLNWCVMNENYKNKIFNVASQINGSKVPDILDSANDFSMKDEPVRWNRAKEYIKNNGLEIKYSEDLAMEREENYKRK